MGRPPPAARHQPHYPGNLFFRESIDTTVCVMDAPAAKRAKRAKFGADDILAATGAFHRQFGIPVLARPTPPAPERVALRLSLLGEELQELHAATAANDLIETADALADIQYVLAGTAHEFGMGGCFGALFAEVHRSNMTKACPSEADATATIAHYRARDGTEAYAQRQSGGGYNVYRKADDKTLKSVSYSPAALRPILDRAAAAADARDGTPPSHEADGDAAASRAARASGVADGRTYRCETGRREDVPVLFATRRQALLYCCAASAVSVRNEREIDPDEPAAADVDKLLDKSDDELDAWRAGMALELGDDAWRVRPEHEQPMQTGALLEFLQSGCAPCTE